MHCHVSRHTKILISDSVFYVQPLQKVTKDADKPWYSLVPLGKHTLHSKLKSMCSEDAISGHKTNHSLRAIAATEMFRCGAPEKLIQEQTGHRSIETLQSYDGWMTCNTKLHHQCSSMPQEKLRSMTSSQYLMSTKTYSICHLLHLCLL